MSRTKTIVRVRDLPDLFGTKFPWPVLLCTVCGGEYSAHSGDYFMAAPDTIMKCCRRPMRLMTKRTVYTEVQP